MEDFLAFCSAVLIVLLEFTASYFVTAGLLAIVLSCFHMSGVLLNVQFSWMLTAGVWVLRIMFGGVLTGSND